MFDTVAPGNEWLPGVALSNPLAVRAAGTEVTGKRRCNNAMLRTTTSPTITRAGNKDNVTPGVPRRR